MKFVFAPDSFKGSISAVRAAQLLQEAARAHFPEAACVCLPVADGGEGTVDALLTVCGGEARVSRVTGPLGDATSARWALLQGGGAALEMAQASGLPLVAGRLNPLAASSRGTGEMLLAALRAGARTLFLGIGGSATNDGGMGMLCALGAWFFDAQGRALAGCGADLARVARVELNGLSSALRGAEIHVLCDVSNPLLGDSGATAVYGPQKGVTAQLLPELEAGMANYARHLSAAVGRDVASFPGAGAAGGLGAALGGVLGAKMRPGIDTVLSLARFDEHLEGCDLVVTGEGRLDRQSVAFGKAPAGVARRCRARGVPVVAMVGGVGAGAEAYHELGQTAVFPIVDAPMTLDAAMRDAERLFSTAADRLFRVFKMGASARA